ncbi:hypothetical protein H1D32_09320 [Anaerobacillus sp. CMMVII]|uniref:toast rack family protein n=1 Tax=Anaerobacillus sp. CMMVII TaxID=2755588 RepID=UPI0021B73B47|nr:toast rack family protein [Anaerobacillus sp. CMMVII]MCT8137936.1 hypothetical protein [Anaerobacillus sp. CMMVII]
MKKWIFFLGTCLLFLAGCSFSYLVSGPTETVTESIEFDESLKEGAIELHFGVGELKFIGSSDAFVHGQFTYSDESLVPKLNYRAKNEKATLQLKPKKSNFTGTVKNEWELAFTDQIPLSFDLNLGVGESHLKFSNLQLTELSVQAGVGETVIDLSEVISTDFTVNVSSGVGSTKLIFSENQAVIVDVSKGIGSVSADGFVKEDGRYKTTVDSDQVIKIFISQGVGEVTLETK